MVNMVEVLKQILEQEAHEFDRKLGETMGRLNCELRDKGAFSGTVPVLLTKKEYEKDIEHRRDAFLSLVEQSLSGMSSEQRHGLSPAMNDLARWWLGPHVADLQEKLEGLATRLQFSPDSSTLDLGCDRVFEAIDAQLHVISGSLPPTDYLNRTHMEDTYSNLQMLIARAQSLMVAYVTGQRDRDQPRRYEETYGELELLLDQLKITNPNPHKTLQELDAFCRLRKCQ